MLSLETISQFGVIPFKQKALPSLQHMSSAQQAAAHSSTQARCSRCFQSHWTLPAGTVCPQHRQHLRSFFITTVSGQTYACLSHRATKQQCYISSTNGALCCSGIISEACASPAAPPPACHGRTHRAAAKLCSSFCSDTLFLHHRTGQYKFQAGIWPFPPRGTPEEIKKSWRRTFPPCTAALPQETWPST